MTAIEHHELKGITIRNLIVTIMSTASIVASVMTTYFGLKADIQEIRSSQATEAKVNVLRIKMLEEEMVLLQKQVDEIKLRQNPSIAKPASVLKPDTPALLSAIK